MAMLVDPERDSLPFEPLVDAHSDRLPSELAVRKCPTASAPQRPRRSGRKRRAIAYGDGGVGTSKVEMKSKYPFRATGAT